jgi:hypothetical protein
VFSEEVFEMSALSASSAAFISDASSDDVKASPMEQWI